MNLKTLIATVAFLAASSAQAIQFSDLQVKGGGYASWTPYYAGMPLTAGTVELKGTIIPDANEMYGTNPGAGFFSVNEDNCVVDTGTGAFEGLVDYTKLLPALKTVGCIPTFDIVGYPIAMSSTYQLSFNTTFSVSILLSQAPAKIHYKMRQGTNDRWGSSIYKLGNTTYTTRDSLTFNAPATTTNLFAEIETKFPASFLAADSVAFADVSFNHKVWTAKAYTSGWYVGVNNAGEVWYIVPGATQEVKFADSITSALAQIAAM